MAREHSLPRWKEIDGLFAAALDLPPEEREPFLDGACRGDGELREAVRELLQASGESVRYWERSGPRLVGRLWAEVAGNQAEEPER